MSLGPFTVVVNPRAAAGRSMGHLASIETELRSASAQFVTKETNAPGHATLLVRQALESGTSGIACIGGDGTLHEVVNGFFNERGESVSKDCWLAPLPCGTGGDFRRTLGIPRDPVLMTRRMLAAEPRAIDVGRLCFSGESAAGVASAGVSGEQGTRIFINIASFGVSGRVVRLVNGSPKWLGGRLTFGISTARATLGYRPPKVRLFADGVDKGVHKISTVAVANGQFFGGGMRVAPSASIDDQLLSVTVISDQGLLAQVRHARRLYDGKIASVPGVVCFTAKKLRAEPVGDAGSVLIDADGEGIGQLPATFEILENALLLRA